MNSGELKALIASARNSRFWRSVIKNRLESPMSTCLIPGPRSVLTAQFPNLPGAGSFMVLGSNQMNPPPEKFLYGVCLDGATQSETEQAVNEAAERHLCTRPSLKENDDDGS